MRIDMRDARWWTLVAVVLSILPLAGCSKYALRGKVVDGPVSSIMVVDQHDPRLQQPGLNGASVEVIVDPASLGRKRLPVVTSEDDGTFAAPVGEPGAGFLQYDIRVLSQMKGRQTAERELPLPGSDKRLLIVLSPGRDTHQREGDPNAFLKETLEMSEPYLSE